ncbi:M23 family metallopeptidase [Bacteroides neonati]|uniref:M23 family metallopeptidase n=1 Tax=Bacteroides neonati TaxID=1347393 RepID=UPI0005A7D824|nr:M23 family metallopeptidase [Bacteroides neonati]MCP3893370.1 M23 family metallopeptidase [Bacteroides sp.]
MKSLLTIFILFQNCFFLQAQFYTVSKQPASYKVQKQQDLPEVGEASKNDPSTKVGKSKAECPNEWIQQYLSVSYPMDRMVVNSPYGWRRDPFTGKQSLHNGIDFHARSNEVYAVMEGEVIKVGHDKRSGNYVTIRHGNYTVSYCHLSKALVRKNTVVKPGEVVAITGNTGTRTTGEHLHLSAKYKGKYINPNILLDFIKETKDKAIARYSSHAAHNQMGYCHSAESYP